MAGRRPKPTHLKLLQGNPGKRPINPNEPRPKIEIPPAPEHLSEAAKTEWNRIAEVLARLRLLTALDRAALAAYCTVYARWVEAEEALKKTGPVVKSPSGYPMISPYLVVANRALEQMRAYLVEFGLSPASRSRISVNTHEEPDAFENWMRDKA
jgi:P27 family predicted phage terminase small subunit